MYAAYCPSDNFTTGLYKTNQVQKLALAHLLWRVTFHTLFYFNIWQETELSSVSKLSVIITAMAVSLWGN